MPVNAFRYRVRVADRGEHAAHVRADGHQRADKHRMLFHVRHRQHRDCERHEGDQRHIIGDEHAGEERQCDQREHQATRGFDVMQQARADDAEHADALEAAHHKHQADQLRDGAGVDVAGVFLVWRHDEARYECEYGSDYENGLVLQDLDDQSPHAFPRQSRLQPPCTPCKTQAIFMQTPRPLYPKMRLARTLGVLLFRPFQRFSSTIAYCRMLLQTGETENKARKSSQINPACAKILSKNHLPFAFDSPYGRVTQRCCRKHATAGPCAAFPVW